MAVFIQRVTSFHEVVRCIEKTDNLLVTSRQDLKWKVPIKILKSCDRIDIIPMNLRSRNFKVPKLIGCIFLIGIMILTQ